MDYSLISEIQVTKTDGTIEIYRGQGLEKFKKMTTVFQTAPAILTPVANSKYATQNISIKPMSGNIYEQAEQMKKAAGFIQ